MPSSRAGRALGVLGVAGLLLAACDPAGTPAVTPVDGASPSIDPRLLAPLQNLPPCADPPPAAANADVVGLILPPSATVTQVMSTGPITQVTGFVAMTPIQVRVDYQGRTDIQVISAEDEGFEAEVLVSDGEHRTFFKAQAQCSEGSLFVAVVAPEEQAGAVPTPSGGG